MKSRSTLATWLGGLDGCRLARVLEARRDAASPPEPRSVGELADRLQRPGSVALALPRLALPQLQVAEALAALRAPASRDALAELLGAADGEAARELEAVLEALTDHALVWPDSTGKLRMAGPLRQAWDAPLGLDAPLEELLPGTTSDELRGMLAALGVKPPGSKAQRLAALVKHHSDPERILSVVAKAPAAARKLLEDRAGAGRAKPARFVMFGSPGPDPEPGARWALERGFLVQDRGPARMPAEVSLALRGPGPHAPFQPVPPSVGLAPVTPTEVDHEASAAASAFAAGAASVLSACSASAPARLKSGGIGRVRIAPASCVLHGDEPALLAEIAAHRKLAKLGLRQLAPTVLISRRPLDTTLAALRGEGYAPVAETAEGTVRIEKSRPRRAAAAVPAPRSSGARSGGRIAAASKAKPSAALDPSTLAMQLLAAPATTPEPAPFDGGAPFATDTEEIVAGWAKRLPYSDIRQLAHAIDAGQAITVEYAASGNRTVRTLSRLELDPPYLEAWCHLRDAERVFTLSRIHGVMSAARE